MIPRGSVGFLGVSLALFWVFGLLLSVDRARVDEAYVLPSLKAAADVEVDTVVVDRLAKGKEAEEYRFTRSDDLWNLQQGSQSVKVEAFRIRDLVRELREARNDSEAGITNDPALYGLKSPQATITLIGKTRKKIELDLKKDKDPKPEAKEEKPGRDREWKFFVGNESVDKKYVYVATSDRPGRVFAVSRASLNNLFFKNANDLRSKRIFDFSEPTVIAFDIHEGANELDAKKTDSGVWTLVKPNLGYADYEGPPLPKDAPLAKSSEGGIRGLINAIAGIRVDTEDDFVAPAPDNLKRFGLEAGKEILKIRILSGDTKKPSEETLLVGPRDKDHYPARLATDEGIFKIPAKAFEPILAALKNPEKLRNLDLAPISIKEADALVLKHGKEEARLFQNASQKNWLIELGSDTRSPANSQTIERFLASLQGPREVKAFEDVTVAEAAKIDAERGFDAPTLTAAAYVNGLDTSKDAKKNDPKLGKDAKPAIAWQFGKTEKDRVHVKRTLADGSVSRFSIEKALLDRLVSREGILAFAEPTLPKFNLRDVAKLELDRAGKKTTLEKDNDRWFLLDAEGAKGRTPADLRKVEDLAKTFGNLQVRRWVRRLDPKDDLAPLGLATPGVTLTMTLKKDKLNPQALGSTLGQLGGIVNNLGLAAIGAAVANQELAAGERIVLKFGNEAKDVDDTGNVFVQHNKVDRLSLVSDQFVKLLSGMDFRDRSVILLPGAYVGVAALGPVAGQPLAGFAAANPVVTGLLGRGDANQVKELKITVRTPVELRSFAFARKDKTWADQSGLKEFQIDEDRVNSVAEMVATLPVERLVFLTGGPKADQKLTAKDATLIVEAVLLDGKTITLTVGASFENAGMFAQVSTWPGAVFFVNSDRVQPLLRGAGYFAKERVAAN